VKVKEVPWARLFAVNSEDRITARAVNRWFTEKKWARMSEGNREYYVNLHSYPVNGICPGRDWAFPLHCAQMKQGWRPQWIPVAEEPAADWLKKGEKPRSQIASLRR
jgi:hypothetical protein